MTSRIIGFRVTKQGNYTPPTNSIQMGASVEEYNVGAPTETEVLINETGTVDNLDINRVATSASNAASGNFLKVRADFFENITYKIREDGTVALIKDGQIIGFTDLEGIGFKNATAVTADGGEASTSSESVSETPTNEQPQQEVVAEQHEVQMEQSDAAPTPLIHGEVQSSKPITGVLSPGTMEKPFKAQPYNLDSAERKELIALVYSEASENPDYVVSDSMGVTSTVLNRADASGGSVHGAITAAGQFNGYGNEKFTRAMNDMSVVPQDMIDAVDRVLAGERNVNTIYFYGDGTKNTFC